MKKLATLILAAMLLLSCAGSSLAEPFSEDPTVVLTYDQYTQWPGFLKEKKWKSPS